MNIATNPERYDTVVIGGGQAGLATGYYLAQANIEFVILEAHERVGDSWRKRWDTLRVFTPARYDSLPGMPYPAPNHSFPTKDEIADYLERYATTMNLPVLTGIAVDRVIKEAGGFRILAGDRQFQAKQVVIATGAFHDPRIPDFAGDLDPGIRQLHSRDYRNPAQLQTGGVLVVGASNSGAEIARDIAAAHEVWLSGRDTGKLPFDVDGRFAHVLDRVVWFAFNHVLTVGNPIGRKAKPKMRNHGGPLERVKPAHLEAAGVHRRFARTSGVLDGKPMLDDGTVLDVANVIWCTGYRHEYGWIEPAPPLEGGWPIQDRGAVPDIPGLYFMGLPFQYSFASPLIGAVGRDARYVAGRIASDQAKQVARPAQASQVAR